jgi:hypothetical protein
MKKTLLFLLFSLCIINSCKKDSINPVEGNLEPIDKYIPMKIGNKWEYSYNTGSEIAVIERILKNNIIHEDGSNIWGYSEAVKLVIPNPDEPIVGYYTTKTEGLYYYSFPKDTIIPGTNILCSKQLILKSPVKVGTQWESFKGAVSHIASIDDIQILNKIYPKTALVITENGANIDSCWYSENIGLVKRVFHLLIGQPDSLVTKWELRDYSLF